MFIHVIHFINLSYFILERHPLLIMAHPLLHENVWLQQQKFEDAERLYRQLQAGTSASAVILKPKLI